MVERDDDLDLPPRMKEALRGLYSGGGISANRDAEILRVAKEAGIAAGRRRWRWAVGMGLAAAVALAGTLWMVEGGGGRHGAKEAAYVRTGDIRDAYYLARQLKAGHSPKDAGAWDANHDGKIDDGDVQALAVAAVKRDAGGVR